MASERRKALGIGHVGWLTSTRAATLGVLLCGCWLEAALLFSWLPAFSLSGHQRFLIPPGEPLVWALGPGPSAINRFVGLQLQIAVPYLLALVLAQRASPRITPLLAFVGSLVMGATMLALYPVGATDLFHNILDGRLFWVYHLNPIIVPPRAIAADPLYPFLTYWQGTTTAYGPLWFLFTAPAALLTKTSVVDNIIAFKAVPWLAQLVSLVLIAGIVDRLHPGRVGAAVLCFGWNPLVLWETAGNGHNDSLMMMFALLAILCLLSDVWPLAFTFLACSVLVKYVSLVLLPVFVVWIVRRRGRRALRPLLSGLALALAVAVVIFLPFWAGRASLAPLFAQQNRFISSPAAALTGIWGEKIPATRAVTQVKTELRTAFAVLYCVALVRLRPSPASLARASVEVMFLVLVLLTWWFWPWYVIWLLALGALLPGTVQARLSVLFSLTALLTYVCFAWGFQLWGRNGTYPWAFGTALVVFTTPVLYALMRLWAPVREQPWQGESLAAEALRRDAA